MYCLFLSVGVTVCSVYSAVQHIGVCPEGEAEYLEGKASDRTGGSGQKEGIHTEPLWGFGVRKGAAAISYGVVVSRTFSEKPGGMPCMEEEGDKIWLYAGRSDGSDRTYQGRAFSDAADLQGMEPGN